MNRVTRRHRTQEQPIDAILTAKQRYGALGETALKEAKAKGLLDW